MNASNLSGGTLAHDPQAFTLWEKLRRLSFDSGSGPRTFAARLASEQGWSAAFTARAIEEYRRFLLLFALGERQLLATPTTTSAPPTAVQIVPSEAVDKVWHLHLLYTHSYWDDLCHGILGAPLHHLPADGSGGEAASLEKVYRSTLNVYEQTFGQSAPRDIWPVAEEAKKLPAPQVIAAASGRARSVSASGMLSGKRVLAVLGVGAFLAFLFAQEGFSVADTVKAVSKCVAVGGILFLIVSAMLPGQSHGGPNSRRTTRRNGFFSGGGEIGGGWACSGSGSSDGGTNVHHDSGHSGGHDGGGHSHSCGGHSCGGGHGCGGGGCGGGGCGGGH